MTVSGIGGEVIRVTVLDLVDPARSGNELFQADPGNRLVGVKLRVENVGDVVYDDSPSNGMAVVDTADQQHDASWLDLVEPELGAVTIRPGDQRTGFVTFEVPRSTKLRLLQFTASSGFGNETGEWRLR